jgi:hypothetical protein
MTQYFHVDAKVSLPASVINFMSDGMAQQPLIYAQKAEYIKQWLADATACKHG